MAIIHLPVQSFSVSPSILRVVYAIKTSLGVAWKEDLDSLETHTSWPPHDSIVVYLDPFTAFKAGMIGKEELGEMIGVVEVLKNIVSLST